MVVLTAPPAVTSDMILVWLNQAGRSLNLDTAYQQALADVLEAMWPQAAADNAQGSRILLPCLCCQALGGSTHKMIEVNAAWALLYLAAYLLDKIEDQETDLLVFNQLGVGPVANLTTGMILWSEDILNGMIPDGDVNLVALDHIRNVFTKQALSVCAGQHADLTIQEPDFDAIWQTVAAKSGRFFALGGYLGARLITANQAVVDAMARACWHFGIVFQILNDLGGLGTKTGSKDLHLGKQSLPVVSALSVLDEIKRNELSAQVRAAPFDPNAKIKAREMIIKSGAVLYLLFEAEKHRHLAKSILNSLLLTEKNSQALFALINQAFDAQFLINHAHRGYLV